MADLPKPVDAMSEGEYRDFINELYVAAHEHASLWEVPRGAVDPLPSGDVVHGPWRLEDCANVLLAWCRAGLLSLYRERDLPDATPLPGEEAARLLADPARWVQPDDRSENINLRVLASAPSAVEEWLAAARRS